MKLTSQIWSATSRMPVCWPAKTVLKFILRRPMQIRPHWVTRMVRSLKGIPGPVGADTRGLRVYTPRPDTGHPQCLVRAVVVVYPDELVELLLLLQEVVSGRLGGFSLQRQVHLMAPVLLRMSGLDAFDADPKSLPPHRQSAQAEQGVGRAARDKSRSTARVSLLDG